MKLRTTVTGALAAALLVPAAAIAVDYPAPSDPSAPTKRPSGGRTLKVCKACTYKTIQSAVDAAKAGDTIKVANGTYHEGVLVKGSKKAFLTLLGNARNPSKVVLEGKGLHGAPAQNGVQINGANNVTVRGFRAQDYKANGFFAVNVDGYKFTNLVAKHAGSYGLYGFNSKGGEMSNSEAYYNDDAGFYIGQTPKQAKPKRSVVKNIRSWGNAIGWSGTNMRYVTITRSEFFNNAIGVLPNALDSEKFPPAEDNVIAGNDIFWNNFNYYRGAPFKAKKFGGKYNLPPGIGVLLIGARTTEVKDNRIFGNYLVGTAMVVDFALEKAKDVADPVGNSITTNVFGAGGADLNGRDMAYDGTGKQNCFAGNTLMSPTIPADGNTFAACPGPDPNHADPSVLAEGLNWLSDDTHEKYWIRHDHAAHKGYNPLEHWTKSFKPGGGL